MLNNITESGVTAKKSYLIRKWNQRIGILESSARNLITDKSERSRYKYSLEKKAVLATVLENTKQAIGIMETTQSADVGQYKRFALDIVGPIAQNLIAYDIVSVQAIDNQVGMINYIKYVYGTAKGDTAADYEFGSSLNLGQSDKDYTTGNVDGESATGTISVAAQSGTLAWGNITPSSISIDVTSVTVPFTIIDDGAGNLTGTGLASSGTINYTTGDYAFTLSSVPGAAPVFTSSYYTNLTIAPATQLPDVSLVIASEAVRAYPRRLKAMWAFEAQFELQKEYGQSIEDLLSMTAVNEIQHEIDIEIMLDLFSGANTALNVPVVWSRTAPYAVNIMDHYDSFRLTIEKACQLVHQNTRKVRPNFMLCGTEVSAVLRSMRASFEPSNVSDINGPYFLGTLEGNIKVFSCPDFVSTNFLLGYKGSNLLDAGYVYCPYMPIITTSVVQLEDMAGRKGWATMYGKKMINPLMYIRGSITD